MSRPPKPAPDRQSRQVIFRLTPADYHRLEQIARKAGMGVNELARRLTCSRRDRLTIQIRDQADPALISQVRRIGLNLNQLIHNAHIFGRVSPSVERLCEEIRSLVIRTAEEEEA